MAFVKQPSGPLVHTLGKCRPTIWHGNQEMEYRDVTEVEAATIDHIVGGNCPPLGFIKLDLEGADLHALFGARDTLARHRPVVAFENSVHAPEVHGFTLPEVTGYFHGLGYVAMNLVGEVMGADSWFGFFDILKPGPSRASGRRTYRG